MKILILSQYPWKKDNSFGNTYSNIFGKIENIEIANIYMMEGMPDYEPVVKHYYQIPENEVFHSSLKPWKKSKGAGRVVVLKDQEFNHGRNIEIKVGNSWYKRLFEFGKKHHWSLLFLARELSWKFGRINYNGLMEFVNEYHPDIFFLPFINIYYTNRLALYIKKNYDIPMVSYMAMDHYSLKRFSLNPLFWIDRFFKRRMIRNLSRHIECFYCISNKLNLELEKSLGIPCKILYKIPDTQRSAEPYKENHGLTKFLYTGNIYSNRWKTLSLLATALKEEDFGHLDIYTANPITKDIERALNINGFSEIHPPVSQEEVIRLQNDADVLVHAESFDLKNKLLVRCAISTKIMDYLSVGRSILAIGPKDISSIEYLAGDDLAFIANSKNEVTEIVKLIKNNPDLLVEYSNKGKKLIGQKYNPIDLRKGLYNDLRQFIDQYGKN